MKKVVYLICCISLMAACSKEEKEESPTKKNQRYTPMTIGNYWVFEHVLIDTLGNETVMSKMDSIYISRTIQKRGSTYFVYAGTHSPFYPTHRSIIWALRDSTGYIVDTNGFIHFAEKDFSDSLEVRFTINHLGDTMASNVFQMRIEPNQIITKAGTFSALNYHQLLRTYPPLNLPSNIPNPRDWNNFYARIRIRCFRRQSVKA